MSLIQEALRRKDDQDQGTMAIPPKQVPPVMQIPQQKHPQQDPPKKSKAWLVLAISLVAVLLLIVGALALLVHSARSLTSSGDDPKGPSTAGLPKPPSSVRTPATISRRTPETAVTKAESKPKAPISDMAKVEAPEDTSASTVSEVPAGSAPAANPDARKITAPATSSRQEPRAPRTAKKEPARRTPLVQPREKKPVTRNQTTTEQVMVPTTSLWPKLSLLGVMARKTPEKGSAIINNMVVEVGEEVEGVRLLEVQRNGILLEFGGETQFVRVGQSTY